MDLVRHLVAVLEEEGGVALVVRGWHVGASPGERCLGKRVLIGAHAVLHGIRCRVHGVGTGGYLMCHGVGLRVEVCLGRIARTMQRRHRNLYQGMTSWLA